ncbi:MAG: glycoside hydrolase family 25 protein [Candidatus Coprovivens sp.]
MEYTTSDFMKNFLLRNKKVVIPILSLVIVIVLFSVFKEGYSSRLANEEFSEIQGYLLEIRERDKSIYNPLNIVFVDRVSKGIDVSSWQGDIDWEKVKKTGIDYVMIRCGFRNLTNDEIHVDKKFHYNIQEANRLEIPVGVYFYSTAVNEREVLEEATFVLNLIKDYEIIYPVVYDFEMFNENRTIGVSDRTINNNAIKFLDYIRAHGYIGMLYTNLNALNNHWNINKFDGYGIWYAQYIDRATYDGDYSMWQYADNGIINGIVGKVDLNESYITYEISQ